MEVEKNTLGEVTAAKIRKGLSREVVYRHSTSLILLMGHEQERELIATDHRPDAEEQKGIENKVANKGVLRRSERKAAKMTKQKIKDSYRNE